MFFVKMMIFRWFLYLYEVGSVRVIVTVFVMFFWVFLSPAKADDAALTQAFLNSSALQDNVLIQASLTPVMVFDHCHTPSFKIMGAPEVLLPLVFNEANQPIKGALYYSVQANDCYIPRTLNVLVWVSGVGKVSGKPLIPGITHVPVRFQDEITDKVLAWAAHFAHTNKRCSGQFIDDVSQLSGTKILQKKKVTIWHEIWTLDLCSKGVAVPLTFTAREGGKTTFVIDKKKAFSFHRKWRG